MGKFKAVRTHDTYVPINSDTKSQGGALQRDEHVVWGHNNKLMDTTTYTAVTTNQEDEQFYSRQANHSQTAPSDNLPPKSTLDNTLFNESSATFIGTRNEYVGAANGGEVNRPTVPNNVAVMENSAANTSVKAAEMIAENFSLKEVSPLPTGFLPTGTMGDITMGTGTAAATEVGENAINPSPHVCADDVSEAIVKNETVATNNNQAAEDVVAGLSVDNISTDPVEITDISVSGMVVELPPINEQTVKEAIILQEVPAEGVVEDVNITEFGLSEQMSVPLSVVEEVDVFSPTVTTELQPLTDSQAVDATIVTQEISGGEFSSDVVVANFDSLEQMPIPLSAIEDVDTFSPTVVTELQPFADSQAVDATVVIQEVPNGGFSSDDIVASFDSLEQMPIPLSAVEDADVFSPTVVAELQPLADSQVMDATVVIQEVPGSEFSGNINPIVLNSLEETLTPTIDVTGISNSPFIAAVEPEIHADPFTVVVNLPLPDTQENAATVTTVEDDIIFTTFTTVTTVPYIDVPSLEPVFVPLANIEFFDEVINTPPINLNPANVEPYAHNTDFDNVFVNIDPSDFSTNTLYSDTIEITTTFVDEFIAYSDTVNHIIDLNESTDLYGQDPIPISLTDTIVLIADHDNISLHFDTPIINGSDNLYATITPVIPAAVVPDAVHVDNYNTVNSTGEAIFTINEFETVFYNANNNPASDDVQFDVNFIGNTFDTFTPVLGDNDSIVTFNPVGQVFVPLSDVIFQTPVSTTTQPVTELYTPVANLEAQADQFISASDLIAETTVYNALNVRPITALEEDFNATVITAADIFVAALPTQTIEVTDDFVATISDTPNATMVTEGDFVATFENSDIEPVAIIVPTMPLVDTQFAVAVQPERFPESSELTAENTPFTPLLNPLNISADTPSLIAENQHVVNIGQLAEEAPLTATFESVTITPIMDTHTPTPITGAEILADAIEEMENVPVVESIPALISSDELFDMAVPNETDFTATFTSNALLAENPGSLSSVVTVDEFVAYTAPVTELASSNLQSGIKMQLVDFKKGDATAPNKEVVKPITKLNTIKEEEDDALVDVARLQTADAASEALSEITLAQLTAESTSIVPFASSGQFDTIIGSVAEVSMDVYQFTNTFVTAKPLIVEGGVATNIQEVA